jgi:hypothetical protein
MFNDKETYDFFKKLDIETGVKRQKVLSQGDFYQNDKSTEIECILIDKVTVATKEEGFRDAELE